MSVTYNPLGAGHIEIDHAATKRSKGVRLHFRLTKAGEKFSSYVENFFATGGYQHPPLPGKFRRTKKGYSVAILKT